MAIYNRDEISYNIPDYYLAITRANYLSTLGSFNVGGDTYINECKGGLSDSILLMQEFNRLFEQNGQLLQKFKI